MLSNFKEDLANAKTAEKIVQSVIASEGYKVLDISDDPKCYHKGDLKISLPSGDRYVEVKADSRISDTKNILLEDEVYYKESGRLVPGNIHGEYDIYAVVSEKTNTIYFFDFDKLKEIGKRFGTYKTINHPEQYSNCYLLEMCRARQFGALIAKINY